MKRIEVDERELKVLKMLKKEKDYRRISDVITMLLAFYVSVQRGEAERQSKQRCTDSISKAIKKYGLPGWNQSLKSE